MCFFNVQKFDCVELQEELYQETLDIWMAKRNALFAGNLSCSNQSCLVAALLPVSRYERFEATKIKIKTTFDIFRGGTPEYDELRGDVLFL